MVINSKKKNSLHAITSNVINLLFVDCPIIKDLKPHFSKSHAPFMGELKGDMNALKCDIKALKQR